MGFLHKLALFAMLALAAGCASNAPTYSASLANVEAAGKLRGSVAVGKFGFAPGMESQLNTVQARASTFTSPVNNSYADYIAKALETELAEAGKLDAASARKLTGTLEKNDLSAGGFNTNDAEIAVHFRLENGGAVRYDKTLTAKHEWESSFMGGIAIPRAIQNYVVTVQKLLKELYDDADFVNATAK
jgi:hypothetical protein